MLGDHKLWGGNPEDFSLLLINIQIWPNGSALFLKEAREREHMDSIFGEKEQHLRAPQRLLVERA